jgi:hypothetical protein
VLQVVSLLVPLQLATGGQESSKAVGVPPASRPIQWNLRVGAAHRSLGDIDFDTGAYSSLAATGGFPPVAGFPAPPIGGLNGFADRTYLDGFVFMDADTDNPASFLPGTTAFWGYQSDSQVRNGSLNFTQTYNEISSQVDSWSAVGDWEDDISGGTPVIEIEGLVPLDENWSVGGQLGLMFLRADAENQSRTFSATRTVNNSLFTVTDRYDLQGVIPPLAPYNGTYNSPGTAPLIDNIPTDRITSQTGGTSSSQTIFNQVSESLRIHLYSLSLGPSMRYEKQRFVFTGGAGLAINLADWDASFDEKLTLKGSKKNLRNWSSDSHKTDVLPGFYLQGSAGYRITDQWMFSAFGRYDWSQSLTGRVGPSAFSADLSGFTLGGAFTFTF